MITYTLYALVGLEQDRREDIEVAFDKYEDVIEYAQDNDYGKYRVDIVTLNEVSREDARP